MRFPPRRTAAALSALLLIPATDSATTSADRRQDAPFAVGERLEYRVKFGLFTVGHASLEVVAIDTVRGTPVWHVVFAVRGRALTYTLNDSLQSWFGVSDMVSRRFIQDNEENGRHRYRRYEIFPERGIWVRNDTDTGLTVEQPLDDASFLYFARTVPLEVGRTYHFPRYYQRDRNPVTLRVLQRQHISVPAGEFATIAIRPLFQSRGLFGQGGQAVVWLSDDASRIPVRIRSSLPIGTLELSLRARTTRQAN